MSGAYTAWSRPAGKYAFGVSVRAAIRAVKTQQIDDNAAWTTRTAVSEPSNSHNSALTKNE